MRIVESLHLDEVIVGISVEDVMNAVLLAVLGFGFDHDPGGDHALVERVDVVGDDGDDHPSSWTRSGRRQTPRKAVSVTR